MNDEFPDFHLPPEQQAAVHIIGGAIRAVRHVFGDAVAAEVVQNTHAYMLVRGSTAEAVLHDLEDFGTRVKSLYVERV